MGRAINNENKLDEHEHKFDEHGHRFDDIEHRLVLVEDALEELAHKSTKVKHITKNKSTYKELEAEGFVADSKEAS